MTTDASGKFRILSPEAANRLRLTVTKEGFPARTEDTRATGPVFRGGLILDTFILSTSPRAVLDTFWLEPAETRYPGATGMHFKFAGGPYPPGGVSVWLTFSNTEAVDAIDVA
ncbi:MAG: hypothetical protein IT186_07955, partial [Acidobacteria bacterium]|nr:hypothetical protein [Acidobacteriota bacterium]